MSLPTRLRRVVERLDADVEHHAVVVERTRGLDVDGGADTARGDVGAAGLVDLDGTDRFRGEVGEVEGASCRRRCRLIASPPPKASAAGIWRPFNVTRLYCGPKPRAVTSAPSPLRRSIEMPVIRCSDSARLVSGNLPMSSAVIASTTPIASRLMSIEAFKLPRKPVTTTSSSSSLACSCANTGLMRTAPPTMVNRALEVECLWVEFHNQMSPPHSYI